MTQVKASDISPTTLRLAPALRTALQREAVVRGSSLSQEIVRRLIESYQQQHSGHAVKALTTGEHAPANGLAPPLGDDQRLLLRLFSELSRARQAALLVLLQNG